jgi:hypothetical protein
MPSNTAADAVIHVFKDHINKQNITEFRTQMLELQEYESVPWDYIFQKVYLHACLKKYQAAVDVLTEKFTELDPITQIAIRQVFPYGRYLLKR